MQQWQSHIFEHVAKIGFDAADGGPTSSLYDLGSQALSWDRFLALPALQIPTLLTISRRRPQLRTTTAQFWMDVLHSSLPALRSLLLLYSRLLRWLEEGIVDRWLEEGIVDASNVDSEHLF